ncbi:hypothetical protein XAP412_70010 [Xanthomonas phaseoli pv. phaseoli]|uniref:Uncharacterized protein n=1 Tax=Xanthomonas campestris pv. phaseoli TaxID=317013 RepID=A0AB38DX33_XANCH|nr:hypothetical protein XAP6984_1540005 [Xanthomonas phaseoli pv. phaseoli]SON83578.1 hypothetical protein XAP7430_1470012 [Xanthomonas phaseoli pv. phaseoli]SON89099.1 hypothetical protein XAP412_70010 [Xanthomonas phaseoli pv. phaseoli]
MGDNQWAFHKGVIGHDMNLSRPLVRSKRHQDIEDQMRNKGAVFATGKADDPGVLMIGQVFLSDVLLNALNFLPERGVHLGAGTCNAHHQIVS